MCDIVQGDAKSGNMKQKKVNQEYQIPKCVRNNYSELTFSLTEVVSSVFSSKLKEILTSGIYSSSSLGIFNSSVSSNDVRNRV